MPKPTGAAARRPLDWLGAVLTVFGLAGPVLALIRPPAVGWCSPVRSVGGRAARRVRAGTSSARPSRCCRSELFTRRNFAFGNLQTFSMYGGLGSLFFFLTLFLQQVAGYTALEAGLAQIPTTLVMFTLSRRAGRLADRYGPRYFMGFGPLVAPAASSLMLRARRRRSTTGRTCCRALLLFSFGLVGDRRAADRDRPRRRRREQRGHRLRASTTRSRGSPGSSRSPRIGAAVAAAYASRTSAGDTLEVVAGAPETLAASVYAFHVGIARLRLAGRRSAASSGWSASATRAASVSCEDCAAGALRGESSLPGWPGACRPRALAWVRSWMTPPPPPSCAPGSSRRSFTARRAACPAPRSPVPSALLDRTCADCNEPVVTSVLDRFAG